MSYLLQISSMGSTHEGRTSPQLRHQLTQFSQTAIKLVAMLHTVY